MLFMVFFFINFLLTTDSESINSNLEIGRVCRIYTNDTMFRLYSKCAQYSKIVHNQLNYGMLWFFKKDKIKLICYTCNKNLLTIPFMIVIKKPEKNSLDDIELRCYLCIRNLGTNKYWRISELSYYQFIHDNGILIFPKKLIDKPAILQLKLLLKNSKLEERFLYYEYDFFGNYKVKCKHNYLLDHFTPSDIKNGYKRVFISNFKSVLIELLSLDKIEILENSYCSKGKYDFFKDIKRFDQISVTNNYKPIKEIYIYIRTRYIVIYRYMVIKNLNINAVSIFKILTELVKKHESYKFLQYKIYSKNALVIYYTINNFLANQISIKAKRKKVSKKRQSKFQRLLLKNKKAINANSITKEFEENMILESFKAFNIDFNIKNDKNIQEAASFALTIFIIVLLENDQNFKSVVKENYDQKFAYQTLLNYGNIHDIYYYYGAYHEERTKYFKSLLYQYELKHSKYMSDVINLYKILYKNDQKLYN